MSVQFDDDAPRGFVPMREYLRLRDRVEYLEAELDYRKGKPPLTVEQVTPGSKAGRRLGKAPRVVEPREGTDLWRVLSALRRLKDPVPCYRVDNAVGGNIPHISRVLCELEARGLVFRSLKPGTKRHALWQARQLDGEQHD